MPSSNNMMPTRLRLVASSRNEGNSGRKLDRSSHHSTRLEPPRSPTSSQNPTTEIRAPVSPNSAADVYLILDEVEGLDMSLLSAHSRSRRLPTFSLDASSFIDEDPSFFDDELSQWSSEDEDWGEEEELLGLSFVPDEKPPRPKRT